MTVANAGLFSQLLAQFPRAEFKAHVAVHQAERHAKGFTCYIQFVAMLFCHLARAESLREICHGLRSCGRKLKHLGLQRAPARSTLAYANAHRPPELYRDLFFATLKRLRAQSQFIPRQHRFSFTNPLLSLDSTIVQLCLSLFPWADFNRTKGGIKVHVVLDHADYLPRYVAVGSAREHDVRYARTLSLPQGSIIAVDKGYMDLALLYRWHSEGVFFVTPEKMWLSLRTVKRNAVPPGSTIISDKLVRFIGQSSRLRYPEPLRRIELDVEDRAGAKRRLILLTNQLGFDAETIAEIYKERWQIELFFKALKQNLTLRSFVGTTENALMTQIWTALIAMLLLKWLHYMSTCRWSLSNLAATLRLNLFTYRELTDFLNAPWDPPPSPEEPAQLRLAF
jgi:hypothetical protein